MDEKELENVLFILNETKKAVKKEDAIRLKELSNKTIHSASVYQDSESILIAVIVYSLSKALVRKDLFKSSGWGKFIKQSLKYINQAIDSLKKKNIQEYKENLGKIRDKIDDSDKDVREYIKEVFRKASINKASKIYEHGISMEKTANLLGISIWELQDYSGQTNVSEEMTKTVPIKKRIKFAMDLFK